MTDTGPSWHRGPRTGRPAPVAVCSAEAYSDAPAGPALRAAGIARGLATHGLDVVLVAPAGSRAPDGCEVAPLEQIEQVVAAGATVIASGFLLERYPALADSSHLVVDAAGPFLLENLVVHETQTPARRRRVLVDEAAVLARLLAAADLVLCAHDRQRDLTLGMMLAGAALRPELIDPDPSLAQLFINVPFGPTAAVRPLTPRAADGRIHVVWPGGLWDWLDPVCLVSAIADARARGTEVTAELWGARSSDPLIPPSRAAAQVAQRARQLGVEDVVEIVGWVPHAERGPRLAAADVAVTLDWGGIEARYAFRTRLVDALASGLPVIATRGEFVADEAARRGAGFIVPPGDSRALADLLVQLSREPARLAEARAQAPGMAAGWTYERTVEPLAAWCRVPRRARAGSPGASRSRARQRPWGWLRERRAAAQRASNSSTSAS